MVSSRAADSKESQGTNLYPQRTPRFWHGMRFFAALRLLARNQFRVHLFRWGMVFTVLICGVINSVLSILQRCLHGRKIAATSIETPPVFIVGHWRSGTTYLHELLVRDKRFAYASTYDCFAPHHFVITTWLLPKMFWFLLPEKRPMDNMQIGFDRPQEDDIALCGLDAPTPYFRLAFPNQPPPYNEFLNMEGLQEKDLHRYKQAMRYFVQCLTYAKNKPLILKSPPHTGQIEVLAELFPGAKFIHIVRDPRALFPSTKRTWQSLDASQAFQKPHHRDLDEYILRSLVVMYEGFERQRKRLKTEQICDVRYEDLVADPMGEITRIYGSLELGDIENIRPAVEEYLEMQRDYRVNVHSLDPSIEEAIASRWAGYCKTYGYRVAPSNEGSMAEVGSKPSDEASSQNGPHS